MRYTWGTNYLVNNRRSEIEIISQILSLSRDGARKTEILYQGNLSYTQLQSYLPFLINRNILEEQEVYNNGFPCKLYKTTDKGLSLLASIRRVLVQLD